MKDKVIKLAKVAALSSIISLAGNANAGSVGIAQTPLFLGSSVQPNVFFVNDDSGSMDWSFMTRAFWLARAYDPNELRVDHSAGVSHFHSNTLSGSYYTSGLYKAYGDGSLRTFYYIYKSSDDVYSNGCSRAIESCPDTTKVYDGDWRIRAAAVNTIFYSTDAYYEPWSGPCDTGVDCVDAKYNAARSNPRAGSTGYTDLRDMATDGDADNGAFAYEVWIDDARFNPAHGRPYRGDSFNYEGVADGGGAKPNGIVDLWDTHLRFTVDNANVLIERITYDPHPSGSNRGLNETTSVLGTISSSGVCYNILGSSSSVASIHLEGASPVIAAAGGAGCRTIADVQTNVANWYQYSRRRLMPVKGAVAAVIEAQPNFRYGITLINQSDKLFVEVPDQTVTNTSAHNENLKEKYFIHKQAPYGTPLKSALNDAGRYYDDTLGKTDPIIYSCQKNFTILFTDGYYNSSSASLSDLDGDGVSNTLADVAYKYYFKDLSPFDNNVLLDKDETDLPTYGSENDRTIQHMVTFTVAFGVNGYLYDNDGDGEPDFRNNGSAWTDGASKNGDGVKGWGDTNNSLKKIDDLWHAAFNSGGTYAAASTPAEVTEKLIEAISNIADRVSSAAAVALNSGTLNANSRVYQAAFDSNDWSGTLKSVPIQDGDVDELPLGSPDGIDDSPPECAGYPNLGDLCDEEWNAADKLAVTAASDRKIYSYNPTTEKGILFKDISALNTAQLTALKTNADTLTVETDAIAQLRLDYIRGDNANEGSLPSEFRKRKALTTGSSKLGDIINSAPAYVDSPDFFIPDDLEGASYNAFKIAYKNRSGVVYVGANDGMLHAFDASTGANKGKELFAYVPGKMVAKLPELTSKKYNTRHTYFVDGSPIVFDAYSGGWKTLLASSSGAGAQLVFGLDVTNPSAFGISNVLWEFTDDPAANGDKDLGYTIGDVSYARMNNGKWVVIFGNGFNNTEADGNASATGNAVIYVVDAFTGKLIRKLDTNTGTAEDPTGNARANGISRVTPIDMNGDFKVDYLYAGDLFGNVWKVDVNSSSVTSWAVTTDPIYIAKDSAGVEQSITTAVSVKRHPEKVDQTLVLFGTGSYFTVNDSSTTQTQTFYGIWDDNSGVQYVRSNLLKQEIKGIQSLTGADGITREFRVSSSADLEPNNYKIDWTTHKGWYLDLGYGLDTGERVNVEPLLRGNRIIFVTLTPDPDACGDGGTSWIMELNANDGSRLRQPPFEVDGVLGITPDGDVIDFGGDEATITSGVRARVGIVAKPGILNTKGNKELKFFSGTKKGKIDTVEESVNQNQRDRQSWRQLR